MKSPRIFLSAVLITVILIMMAPFNLSAENEIITPEKHFGFTPGTDRMLFNYEPLIDYLKKLEKISPKLKMIEIGESPMGLKMYIAAISSEENIKNLDELKKINRQLALNPDISKDKLDAMIDNGKVFLLSTLSMHSGEVGPSQSAPLIAYDLITTTDAEKLVWLNNVVLLMVPCHNPDGMDMVVNNYNKYKGTKYEGCSMPGIYHKYVGHDNNRDFVTLSQTDTKAIAAIYNQDWFPQVMVEKHQMGSRGPRYFVPPMHDPIAENIPAEIWNWTWIMGSNMSTDMTKKGQAGVSQHYLFDDYWPGSTETCLWKNVIGLLTEAASVKYAKPIFIEENELVAYGKGLSEYKKSINMPLPWDGGWWRLSDIVDYEISSTLSLIKTSSIHKKDLLKSRNKVCCDQVKKGKTEGPYYYIFPKEQHDKSELVNMINLLREHNVKVYALNSDISVNSYNYYSGDIVVPLSQAFRPFIKEVLENQVFPVRHYTPGGKIIKPYDITSWSLPLHRGVKSIEIMNPEYKILEPVFSEITDNYTLINKAPDNFKSVVFTVNNNESFKVAFKAMQSNLKIYRLEKAFEKDGQTIPVGSFVINYSNKDSKKLNQLLKELNVSPLYIQNKVKLETSPVKLPRIALVETYFHDMDAGWTRFVFDSYDIPFDVLRPGDFAKTNLHKKYDIVIFPDVRKSVLMSGKYESDNKLYVSSYPPEYTKGIGKEGFAQIMTYIDKGGKIISWGRSSDLFMNTLEIERSENDKEEFQLPISNIAKKLNSDGLYCPGSLLKIKLVQDHPLTLGMPGEIGVFTRGRPIFTTSFPNFDMDRRVIGKYAKDNILMSGYCENEEKLANKSCMVWLKKGKGQLVFFGFNPQFRASTQTSYKLLFNSILLPDVE